MTTTDWTAALDPEEINRLRQRSPNQAQLDVGVEIDPAWWRHDGAVVAALGEGGGQTVHAGRINWFGRLFSMTPLCLDYRKADGAPLAKHERGDYPTLARNLGRPFDEYRRGVRRTARRLCPHCLAVRDRENRDGT